MAEQFLQLLDWQAGAEIFLLAIAIYYLYLQFRGTRGARAFIAFALAYLLIMFLSSILELTVIESLLRGASFFVGIALVVVFQPELRRAITQLANYDFFVTPGEKRETLEMVAEISQALADKRYGALIAIERDMDLSEIAQTGVILEADLSMELALTIFHPKTALHDGGMILRNDRVEAAGCIYPVTQREFSDRSIGLRHRAAMGLAEEFDAVIICVSEETGNISLFHGGSMERALPHAAFKKRLTHLLLNTDEEDEGVEEEEAPTEETAEQRPAPASAPSATANAATNATNTPASRRATTKTQDSSPDPDAKDKSSTHEPDKTTVQQLESETDQPAGGHGSVVSSADKR